MLKNGRKNGTSVDKKQLFNAVAGCFQNYFNLHLVSRGFESSSAVVDWKNSKNNIVY